MAVIAALEFHDRVAAGKAAGQANGAHGRLGAGTDEAHQFDGRHEFHDAPREPRLEFGRGAEAQAVGGDSLHGFDDLGVRVAQDHRSPGTDEVEVAAAIRRYHVGALGLLEENGLAAHAAKGSNRRVDAPRNVLTGFLKQAHFVSTLDGDGGLGQAKSHLQSAAVRVDGPGGAAVGPHHLRGDGEADALATAVAVA